jgi:hypothetical protein
MKNGDTPCTCPLFDRRFSAERRPARVDRRHGLPPRIGQDREAGIIRKEKAGHGDGPGADAPAPDQGRGQLGDRRRPGPQGEPERLYPRSTVRCVVHLIHFIHIDERRARKVSSSAAPGARKTDFIALRTAGWIEIAWMRRRTGGAGAQTQRTRSGPAALPVARRVRGPLDDAPKIDASTRRADRNPTRNFFIFRTCRDSRL